jgi:hypothetical protein
MDGLWKRFGDPVYGRQENNYPEWRDIFPLTAALSFPTHDLLASFRASGTLTKVWSKVCPNQYQPIGQNGDNMAIPSRHFGLVPAKDRLNSLEKAK